MKDDGKYFVVNEDNLDSSPRQIYFDLDDAIEDGAEIIDIFNEDGIKFAYMEKDGNEYDYYEYDFIER